MATKTTTTKKISVPLYASDGKKSGTLALNPDLFGAKIRPTLIKRALVAQRSVSRGNLADTKLRSERRGGGRKPWKQKGTGRARHGSSRSPIWRKGGIVFGPRKTQNFTIKINRKERQGAIISALSQFGARKNAVLALESFNVKEVKTKTLATLIDKLPIERSVLIVIPEHDKKVELSVRNVPNAKTQLANNLNVRDLLQFRQLLVTKDAFKQIEEAYLNKKKK